MHIMMFVNDTTFAYNLRREVIERLINHQHKVTLVCQVLLFKEELESLGCRIIDVRIGRRGTNPISDVKLFCKYFRLLRELRPDVILSNNIKPNVYAGFACRLLGIKRICNITGLGTAVEYPGLLQKLTVWLYKTGVWNAECIFFQNTENMEFFKKHNMISSKSRTVLLPGSGVNIGVHQLQPYSEDRNQIHFLFVARILKEKGIDLYLSCAERICEKYDNIVFHICGLCDDKDYLDILKNAEAKGYIKYHGEQKDMLPFFKLAHCIVHPSYYPEGMSNVLLEAAATGRPIITTNRSGCRETVEDNVSGFVVPVRDEDALVNAVDRFIQMDYEAKCRMGLAGRKKVEREFDREIVIQKYMEEVEKA